MTAQGSAAAELRWANDRALRVSFGKSASPQAHALVRAFVRTLAGEAPPGVVDVHPAYSSVFVVIDPLVAAPAAVESRLGLLAAGLSIEDLPAPRRVEIPIAYGGEHGPDLEEVARLTGLAAGEIVRRHAETAYTVAFLGFVPGFAYLSGLPEELRVARLPAPRRRVPAGSLGLAGGQTAIYPLATPGGWRLIGRTPLDLFRFDRTPPSLLDLGDEVFFAPIDAAAFARLARERS